ncbi:hypothetical protein R3P38DRAFT_2519170 [Favolaschia claudopus]|uniref:Uncharacterized protein n=1 Tax=Favolaschia claudopus TaxID=2862362 RepID=A0AAW0C7C5_9AGAR
MDTVPQTPTHPSELTSPDLTVAPVPFPPHAPPPPPPQSGSPSPSVTVPPLFVDNLAREFGLGDRDRLKLRGLLHVCGGAGLSAGLLLGLLYLLAAILSEAADRRRAAQDNQFGGDLLAMVRDLQIRLDDSFSLTANQKANIRGEVQNAIHEPTRMKFSTMHADVLVRLKEKQDKLDLDNVFGVPVRENKMGSALKRACSSVRNAFRQDIRDSIDPASFVDLEKFTYALARKYKLGGVAGESSDLYSIHAALLRRFAFDHPEPLWTDETEEPESSNPPTKKRKTTAKQGGRVAAGEDFWGKVDVYFKEQIELRGRNFKDTRWKPYIDRILADDKNRFEGITSGAPVCILVLDDSTTQMEPASSFGGVPQSGAPDFSSFQFGSGGPGSWGSSFNSMGAQ